MTEENERLDTLIPQVEIWPPDAYDWLDAWLDDTPGPMAELVDLFTRTEQEPRQP